ncbi:catalase [Rhizobium johnstonii]|uniref:Catalase n=1 Tax=Rhizobium leguminosarum bv. viciae TaxID=387 RepID=A0A8G2J0N9_RHILV|nr:catalase [Rhizobium leguminosarum]NKK06004.1 catalase [Rhizobium leguminosarum bv. viciae]NKK20687.1 catalase [Rhizobium leguminosarum bv. viciae]NKL20057.1 catalase [Rhizobium leguminosarum bv. viciae]TBF98812.1 catalase [Rhizobium leguminosarum]TBX96195.1 catalase [Rhizobium leguminosarum bv. viciae]
MAKKTSQTSPSDNATIHDQKLHRGAGGELHQFAEDGMPVLTTAQGGPVSDDQNTLRLGARGPALIDDFHFREKIFHFDHERIPERVVHARGYGAHGYFETYESLAAYTRADLFQRPGEKTPAFVRFSTVAGSKGSFDLARDVRGFAVKIYTQQGNWDLVGNNIPVFFIQDAIKFPDVIHSVKPEPDRQFPQAQSAHDNFWDFITLTPESMHMIMWVMSDRAIPRSFRFMEGFGVHTFRFVNAADESTFVKFHWKPKLGLQSVAWNEAVKINGADPDFHRRDLWQSIQSGNFPEWELCVQLFDQDFADTFDFDILDPTKLIPEEILPVKPIGRLVLDRMPDNFFAETEQVAFMTQNVPPGIDFSNDPLLQGRNFSYLDTQLKRLGGPNFTHLPINAPKCPFHNFQQDGHMAMRNPVGRVNYQPNSWNQGPRESPVQGYRHFPAEEQGPKVRLRPESFADHYSQARQFYISQTPPEQRHIAAALIFELSKVETPVIRERMVSHLSNIDETLASKVGHALGFKSMPKPADAAMPTRQDLEPSPALSIVEQGPKRFEGRKLGILVSDGTDAAIFKALLAEITEQKATFEVIAPKIGGVTLSDGNWIEAHQMIDGGPSVLYDAVALLPSAEGTGDLLKEATARDFVADAFVHCKFIGYVETALPLMQKAGIADSLDEGVMALGAAKDVTAFIKALGKLRVWGREPSVKLN